MTFGHVPCEDCDGKGEYTCLDCNGCGYTTHECDRGYEHEEDCGCDRGMRECRNCDGTGEVMDDDMIVDEGL